MSKKFILSIAVCLSYAVGVVCSSVVNAQPTYKQAHECYAFCQSNYVQCLKDKTTSENQCQKVRDTCERHCAR